MRTIKVNECYSNRGVTLFERNVFGEPAWGVDVRKPFANRVAAEFIDQGHRGGRVSGLISLDGYAVDNGLCVAFLRDDVRCRSERLGQDGAVFVYNVVGWFAGEGEDEIVGQAGAPSP
jgi:hypothetical protein